MKTDSLPTILITGRTGQVGWELQRTMMPLGNVIAMSRNEMDLNSPDSIRNNIQKFKPDIIINAAAYTAVDRAESEIDLAMKINGEAPGIIASEAKDIGALLIHYSTDYVFDGVKQKPYDETDLPNPINQYGITKLAGERAVTNTDADYLILRTTWVYAGRGHNFLKTVLRLAAEKKELSMIADQIGAPTWSRLIAESTAHVVKQACYEKSNGTFESGLYHLTASGQTSWFGFAEKITDLAREVLKDLNLQIKQIHPISTEEYILPAKRPKNSLLCNDALTKRFKIQLPDWELALKLCMSEGFNQLDI